MKFFKSLKQKFGATLWIFIGTILLTVVLMATVSFEADGYDKWANSVLFTILILIAVAGAISIRYLFSRKSLGKNDEERSWGLMWLLPLAVTLVMLPWILSGVLASEDMSVGVSAFLWVVVGYMMLLVGFLLVPFVVIPLELIGGGIIALFTGKAKQGGSYILVGVYVGLVLVFGVTGALALDNVPQLYAGWPHIIFALLGLPGNYTVSSDLMLWIARIAVLLLIAVPVGVMTMGHVSKHGASS